MCTKLFTIWHLCQYSMFTLNYAYNFSFHNCFGIWLSFFSHPLISEDEVSVEKYTLLQDLMQDSVTLTGWRWTKRSKEGKMIALFGLGIFSLRYQSVIFLLLFSIKSRFLGEIGVWKLRSALGGRWFCPHFSMLGLFRGLNQAYSCIFCASKVKGIVHKKFSVE